MLSLFALIVLLIPMLIIAAIVKLTSPGSVLYKQERLGKDGVSFEIIKFRSMYADAENNGAQWSDGENDERITPFGKFLRRTRMDELPQFAARDRSANASTKSSRPTYTASASV